MPQDSKEPLQRAGLDDQAGSLEKSIAPSSALKAGPPAESHGSDSTLHIPGLTSHTRTGIAARVWSWIKKDTKSTDWFIVLLTAVIAGTSYFQWREIHSGSTDTHTLAVAADTQAKKMSTMSDAADKIKEAAQGMVSQEKRIADDAEKSMQAGAKQSQTALAATIAQFQEEQRAWVGLGPYQLQTFDSKEPLKLTLPWINSGKTPAIDTESAVAYSFSKDYLSGPPRDYKYVFGSASAIAPQGTYTNVVTNNLGPQYFQSVTDGTVWMYFFGRFRYRDVHSKRPHVTDFCLYYDRRSKQMNFCLSGNTMD